MSYDDIIEVLAAALLEKAETVGCLEVLDGFSQRPNQRGNAGVAAGQTGVAGRVHTDFERKQCGHAGRTGGISEPLHSHGEEAECFRRCSGSHVPGAYHILL